MATKFAFILIPLLFIGCATPLQPPEGERAITKGSTTYDQVVAMYGRPKREVRNSEGKTLVSYNEAIARRSAGSFAVGRLAKHQGCVEARRLDILFDANRVVQHYKFFQTAQPVESRFSHFEIGNPVSHEKIAQINKGKTTRPELIDWFGPPISETINFDGQAVLGWLYGKMAAYRSSDFQVLEVVLDDADAVKDFQVQNLRR